MNINYPNFWSEKQIEALDAYYHTIFMPECKMTFNEKIKFWRLHNKLNGIDLNFSPNVEWTNDDKELSMVILCEYNFLDENSLIRIKQ